LSTPSISQALSGINFDENKVKITIPEEYARETFGVDQSYTDEQLLKVWNEFAEKYSDQVHLFNTLSIKPELLENSKIKVIVGNSVQRDQIKNLKPEILRYLTDKLNNSKIDIMIEIEEKAFEEKIFTDEQKLQAMMKKNPNLLKMKNKFFLDFNE
jgi:DNA polymerase III subunit gamma/tau